MNRLNSIIKIDNKKEYFKHLSSLPIPIVVADTESRLILYVNPKAEDLWMRSADELVGSKQTILHSDYWNEKGRETFSRDFEALKNGRPASITPNAALRADGVEIPIEISAIMINIEDKLALVGTFISTQQREDAYKKLNVKVDELDAIFKNSQVGIMYLKGGRFLHKANQKLADILGYDSPDEMHGISMEQLHLSKERFIWFGEHHYESLQMNKSTHINYQLRKKDGKGVWISLSGKAVDSNIPADLNKGVIWIIDDISDYKSLEATLKTQNENLENLLKNINGISWKYDIKSNKFTYVSANAKQILGYDLDEWSDFDSWKMMVHPEDREEAASYCAIETQKGKDHFMEYRMLKKDGSTVWVLDIVSLSKDENGTPKTLFGFILDISKQKNDQLKIAHDREYLQNIVDSVQDPIMVIKNDYTIELMNKNLQEKLPLMNIEDIQNPKCYEVSHNRKSPCDGSEHPCPLQQVIDTNSYTKVIHKHTNKDGKSNFVELAASPLLNDKNECIGIVESAHDITEHLDMLDELQTKTALLDFQAHHDELTGLPNRTLYHDRVEQAIEKAKRLNKKFVLIFIDLDHFKEVNDSLGHDAGDKVLLESTKRLGTCIRSEDTLSRLGGDEFTILLENIDKIQDVSVVAQKILDTFEQPFILEGHTLYLSCSIGISIYPDDGLLANDLLKYADNAMYKAKDEGRNNFQFYTKEMTELVFERMMLESNIRQAIKNNEFVLYYQPQYNANTNELIGMEALIRWQHPTLGIIPPSKFIPLAEESSLIIEIDNWVMKNAMEQVAQWHKMSLKTGILSLNLAIKQLESSHFLETLQATMNDTSFETQWLKLEVLERDVMKNPQDNVEKLNLLHELGIKLSIDDFGTGQSSLTYLKRFPLDQLKIDQSFVRDIHEDEEDDAIVITIIALAKALKLDVIAEGVETKEQLDFLLENGCENIQGYYFSRPLSTEDTEKLLLNN